MPLAGDPPSPGKAAPPSPAEPGAPVDPVDKLLAVLKSDAPHKEKADACRKLAVAGTKEAVPALAALLGDERLSHMARYGLEPIPEGAVDDALRDALGKVKGRPLAGVIASLGVRRDAKAVAPLSRLLGEADPDVVRTAARALGRIATPEAARALRERLAACPAGLRPAVADGCLTCAERLLELGKREDSRGMYESVGKVDLPEHFRLAAAEGATLARQPAG
ncbi:MAG: HEAT repeat domain-containing protein [Planctomycetes bacterium]|nr:HEAT repeat domain-containing protein [Planctomycetota bacterium]